MRAVILAAIASAAASAAAEAQSVETCTRDGDVRSIEVLTPGEVGAACDLRVVRENGAYVSTPYHANNSEAFCAERAVEMVRSLVDAGYECVADAPAVETAATPQPAAPAVSAAAVAPVADDASVGPVAAHVTTVAAQPAANAAAAPDAAPDAAPAAEAAETLAQPAPAEPAAAKIKPAGVASAGPTTLAATNASLSARAPRPSGSAVGRLVGAEPSEPKFAPAAQAAQVAQVSQPAATEERLPAAAPAASTPAAAPDPAPAKTKTGVRPAPAIIQNVLMAQAAAWNDGDLEAFMNGYWKSNDLRFVSGSNVTKGWNQTLKRYRERYGEGGDYGKLAFDKLDVQMVTDDVAVVVGRYNLARGAAVETGAFSLVMRRDDGMWRIVHDHTNPDAPATN